MFVRITEISGDIFRCVYDKNKLPDEHIADIKTKIGHFIEGYVNN